MSLPQPSEYDEAIQCPRIAFTDPELREAENDGPIRCGMTWPVAMGNFAIVYRVKVRGKRYAIKCFTRDKIDQQLRYQQIHDCLERLRLPWTVDFTYLRQGILVKGKLYPIVKMEWVDGAKTLLEHLSESIESGQSIDDICSQFHRLCGDLRKAGIAHGDLQHGNLVVSKKKLLLVDYDGMCVPGTEGMPSEEDGLADYQHPARKGGELRPNIDNFATLVIWSSLYALTIDSSIWGRRVGKDERLLFKRQDFVSPGQSDVIKEMLSYGDKKLDRVVAGIVQACGSSSIEQIPHIHDLTLDEPEGQLPWWNEGVERVAGSDHCHVADGGTLPDWIAESEVDIVPPVVFRKKTPILSLVSGLAIILVVVGVLMTYGGIWSSVEGAGIVILTGGVYSVTLRVAYIRREEVIARRMAAELLSAASKRVSASVESLESRKTNCLKSVAKAEEDIRPHEASLMDVESKMKECERKKTLELSVVGRTIDSEIVSAKRREVAATEKELKIREDVKRNAENRRGALRGIRSSICSRYDSRVTILKETANTDKESRVKTKYDGIVNSELGRISIRRNRTGDLQSGELTSNGFFTLADFCGYAGDGSLKRPNGVYVKVRGVGVVRARDLVSWRNREADRIRRQIPPSERSSLEAEVDRRLFAELQSLKKETEVALAKHQDSVRQLESEIELAMAESVKRERDLVKCVSLELENIKLRRVREEEKIRLAAEHEVERLRRGLWELQSIVNPGRHRIAMLRREVNFACSELEGECLAARNELARAVRENERYSGINGWKFVKHIFA